MYVCTEIAHSTQSQKQTEITYFCSMTKIEKQRATLKFGQDMK